MQGRRWVAVLGVLALMAVGCESRTDDVPPPKTAAPQEEVTVEMPAAAEATEEAVVTEESASVELAVQEETAEPASVEAEEALTPQAEGQLEAK